MILIVGLGNPGRKYEKTRHNIGFRVIDEFIRKNNFPNLKFERKFNALISKGVVAGKKIILALPRAFMNLSGKSVKLLTKNYRLEAKNLIVVHDDIDLPLGKIRISKDRGSAGHKGIESIIKELKSKNFIRFRIGIKPKQSCKLFFRTENFVLQKFKKDEEKIIKEVIKKTCQAIEFALKEGVEKGMAKFNK